MTSAGGLLSGILTVQRFEREGRLLPRGGAAGVCEIALYSAMRWLMLVLFVSLGALLAAVAGMVRHVWLQHRRLRKDRNAARMVSISVIVPQGELAVAAPEAADEELDVQ
jgi:hypothetical protein